MFEYDIEHFDRDIESLARIITREGREYVGIYGIPQGGIPLAVALSISLSLPLVSKESLMDYDDEGLEILIVDDLLDSGKTLSEWDAYDCAVIGYKPESPKHKGKLYVAREFPQEWIHFFWEPPETEDPEKHITRLIEFIGENPDREGLQETPKRVIKSFKTLYGGYAQDPEEIMKTFTEDDCDEMVVLKDITIHSTCEHHMLPFSGVAHIGYIPDGKVIGVSKLARLLEIFARRLQIQERIGEQVTSALMKHLKPLGAVCVIEARHCCMTARGVEQQTTTMITSSLKGVMKEKAATRAEFMQFIKG